MDVGSLTSPEIAGIGLVRTGTGSLSRSFPGKRVSHEQGMPVLRRAALDRCDGLLDDESFVEVTRERLLLGPAQVDISTVHHLYAEVLARIWPRTMFVVTLRDVRGWISSVLGLIQRKNAYLQLSGRRLNADDARYHRHLTGSSGRPFHRPDVEDVIPLMRYWADHLEHLRRVLDTKRVQYRYLTSGEGPHVNRSPMPSLDRMMLGDREALRAAYEATCAGFMDELFPVQHARLLRDWDDRPEPDWGESAREVREWAASFAGERRMPPGASDQGWT